MNTLSLWFSTPLSRKDSVIVWLGLTICLLFVWIAIPMLLHGFLDSRYLAIPLSVRDLAIMMSHAFGEEMVFRVLPILIALHVFRRKIAIALLVELVSAFVFATWHNFVLPATICLGIGASILGVACMKFGAASHKPFQALVVCGSIHITCNLAALLLANICTF